MPSPQIRLPDPRYHDLPGDFNRNGAVDAADYVVWRKTSEPPNGYGTWLANFGAPSVGSGATDSTPTSAEPPSPAVPVPSTLVSFLLCTSAILVMPRDRVAAKNRC